MADAESEIGETCRLLERIEELEKELKAMAELAINLGSDSEYHCDCDGIDHLTTNPICRYYKSRKQTRELYKPAPVAESQEAEG